MYYSECLALGMRSRSFPNYFTSKTFLSENLVKKNFHIVTYMVVKMDIYRSVFTHD